MFLFSFDKQCSSLSLITIHVPECKMQMYELFAFSLTKLHCIYMSYMNISKGQHYTDNKQNRYGLPLYLKVWYLYFCKIVIIVC